MKIFFIILALYASCIYELNFFSSGASIDAVFCGSIQWSAKKRRFCLFSKHCLAVLWYQKIVLIEHFHIEHYFINMKAFNGKTFNKSFSISSTQRIFQTFSYLSHFNPRHYRIDAHITFFICPNNLPLFLISFCIIINYYKYDCMAITLFIMNYRLIFFFFSKNLNAIQWNTCEAEKS